MYATIFRCAAPIQTLLLFYYKYFAALPLVEQGFINNFYFIKKIVASLKVCLKKNEN
jgi:hypothetical protein